MPNIIIKKYRGLSQPIKASLWFVICNVIQKGIQVLSTPIFTRLLTQTEYGIYSVYQSWYTIITVLATLNLAAGVYNNGLTTHPKDKDRFTSSLLGLSSTITVGLFVVYIIAPKFWNDLLELSTVFMLAMFIELLFVPAYSFWSAQQRYFYKYKGIIVASAFIGLIGPISAIIAIKISAYKAEAMVLSFVLTQVLVGIILYVCIMTKGKVFFDREYWFHALKFNIPLIPHYLSQTLLNQSDRIMISRMIGTDKAAVYSVAYTVSMVMTLVISAVNSTLTPYIYQSIKANQTKNLRKNSSLLLIFVFVICLISILMGPEIIRIVAAKEYYEARWVIPPVAASLYFVFASGLYGTVEFYYENTISVMVASVVAAIVNIILNYFGIRLFGYVAAGYTTLICYILMLLIRYC